MSSKGSQNIPKHGRPHVAPHVPTSLLKKIVSSNISTVLQTQKPTIYVSDLNGTGFEVVQDGGGDGSGKRTELEALIEDHSDDLVSTFDSTSSGTNNTEWIMTTVDELGHVTLCAPVDDADPLGLGEGDCGSSRGVDIKPKIDDIDMFDVESPPVSLSSLPADVPTFTESILPARIKMESVTGTKSNPCSPMHSFVDEALTADSNNVRQRSFSDSEEKLTAQDRACLEEIERGSQLTQEDQELLEDSKKRLQLELQDFETATPDKSALMTPQELQTLQERGLEFEGNEQNADECEMAVASVATDDEIATAVAEGATEPNSALATISITTDKKTNSTEIIINTKNGKQVYQLNTSDLNKAASTLDPVTLVNEDGSCQRIFLESFPESSTGMS